MKHGLAILMLATGITFWLPGPADAIKEVDSRFGMVGIVLGQTARLNVVSIDDPNTTPDPDRACLVELMFVDSMGNVLARSMESLVPGHAAFLDFMNGRAMPAPGGDPSVDDPNIRPGQRLQLRGLVRGVDDPNTRGGRPGSCAGLIATLEVFNNETGETMVLQNPSIDNPNTIDNPNIRPAGR